MLKKIIPCILILGIIPCDPALFTIYKNPEMGEMILRGLNLLVCAISAFYVLIYAQKKHIYGSIVTKYTMYFFALIILNSIGTMLSGEILSSNSRTMSLICLCAYYLYGLFVFRDAHSLVKSINITLLILIVMSFILYYTNYEDVTYIENATSRYFKGVATNRNSYAEISLFYIASNLYLWEKSKKHSLYYIITTALAVYTTFLTHSATATICVVLLIALVLLYKTTKKTLPFKTLIIGYAVLFVFLIIIQSGNIPFLSDVIKYFQKDTSLTGRTDIWKIAMNLISEHLIFGRGFDTNSMLASGVIENDPHNGILYMLLTQGLVGTIMFFGMFFKTITMAKKTINDNILFSYMYIFIVVWMVRGFTESAFTYTHFIFWIAIIVIEMLIKERKKEEMYEEISYEKKLY